MLILLLNTEPEIMNIISWKMIIDNIVYITRLFLYTTLDSKSIGYM